MNPTDRGRRGQKPRDTHFLCFPLVNDTSVPQLSESLAYFREITSRREEDDDGKLETPGEDTNVGSQAHKLRIISKRAFRPPGTYHLTLGVMDLSRQVQMDKALALLESIDIKALLQRPFASTMDQPGSFQTSTMHSRSDSEHSNLPSLYRPVSPPATSTSKKLTPLNISLTGMSTFPSAKSARVLYAKPQDPSSRLHDLAVAIRQKFREAGLITETRSLVLHATVGNLRYAVQGSSQKGKLESKRDRWNEDGQIDAREIVKLFDEHDGQPNVTSSEKHEFLWADNIAIDHLAICKLGATKSEDPVLELEYPPIATRSLYFGETDLDSKPV